MNLKKIRFFRFFFDFVFLLYELLFFKVRKKNSSRSYDSMLRLFYLTGGVSNDIINYFVCKKSILHSENNGILSKYDELSIKSFQTKLKREGFIILENILSQQDINDLIYDFQNKYGFYLSDQKDNFSKQKLNLDNPKGVTFHYSPQDIIDNENCHKILFDTSLINFSQDYLKCCPVIDNVSAWWSFPKDIADKNAAQWWHYDLDRPKWLKFFFFLTDCTFETGAHCFVKGSHKNNGIKWSLRNKGYSRLSDEEIEKSYSKEDIITVEAKKGSLLIEDTRGLHKGRQLIKNNRFLIQLQFSSSTFGAKVDSFNFPHLKNEKFLICKKKFRHTYSLFT